MPLRLILSAIIALLAPACFGSSAWIVLFDGTTPGSLARFDLKSGKALPPLSSAVTEPQDAVYSPDGTTIYVASQPTSEFNQGGRQVGVVDASTGALKSTVTIPGEPFSLAISADGSRLYVAYSAASPTRIAVASIDTASGRITETGSVSGSTGTYKGPGRLTLSSDGSTVYLTLGGLVVSFDASTLTLTHSLAIAAPPGVGSAPSRDGTLLFVPNTSGGNAVVTALDTASFAVAWTVTVASGATAGPLTLIPHSLSVFAADAEGLVAEIAVHTKSVVRTYQLPAAASDLTGAPNGLSLIALLSNGVVASMNISTGQATTLMTVPGPAGFESINPSSSTVLIANRSELLQKVDLDTGESSAGVPIPFAVPIQGVAAFPSGRLAFAGGQNGVTVINLASGRYVTTISMPPVSSLVAAPEGRSVYAISGNGLLSTAQLWSIDAATLRATERATLPVNSNDWGAISDDSQTLFYEDSGGLVEVDTTTFAFTVLPGNYGAVATSPGQPSYVYVYDTANGTSAYDIIDYSTGAVLDSIQQQEEALVRSQLVISANGRYGYDISGPSPVIAYDFATGEQLFFTEAFDLGPIALTSDQQSILSTLAVGENLLIFDAHTGAQVGSIPLIGEGSTIIPAP